MKSLAVILFAFSSLNAGACLSLGTIGDLEYAVTESIADNNGVYTSTIILSDGTILNGKGLSAHSNDGSMVYGEASFRKSNGLDAVTTYECNSTDDINQEGGCSATICVGTDLNDPTTLVCDSCAIGFTY